MISLTLTLSQRERKLAAAEFNNSLSRLRERARVRGKAHFPALWLIPTTLSMMKTFPRQCRE